jgi:hypothetical protein
MTSKVVGVEQTARPSRAPWRDGLIAVPYWVVSLILLALLFVAVLAALVFVPASQRPTLEPATSSAPTASST